MTRLIQALLVSFAILVVIMPWCIRGLRRLGLDRHHGPDSALAGMGRPVARSVPTMGGLAVVVVVAAVAVGFGILDASTYSPLAALLGVGAIGAADDYLSAARGIRLSTRVKVAWQLVVAIAAAVYIQTHFEIVSIRVPFVGDVTIGPLLYVAVAVVAILATSNGVRITDPFDGLAAGVLVFAYVAYLIVGLLNVPHQANLALLCATVVGALLAFLWFNVHPAHVRLGDSGSLSLGATLAVIALITGQVVVLPLIGLVLLVEGGSLVAQKVVLRATHRSTTIWVGPVHRYLTLGGWTQDKVTLRLWIVGALAALLGVTLFLSSIHGLA